MIRIEGLNARYGDSLALEVASITVEKGDFYGILGANGAGKTTLLRAISGLVPPNAAGSIRFEDTELVGRPAHVRVGLGIAHVPEGRRMFSSVSVRESLLLGAYRRGSRVQGQRLEEVLEHFPELADRREQPAGSLSGGEQQMLAIARALMSSPRLLILDEPSLGLAPVVVSRVFSLLRELHAASRLTIVLVEQNVAEAAPLMTRGCVLERGQVIVEGTRAELLRAETLTKAYLGG